MFQAILRSELFAANQQPRLKNSLLLKLELVRRIVFAVRIPGGITPP